jgi:hypothetical protein
MLGDFVSLVGADGIEMDTSTDPARVIRYRTRHGG